jgi:hypothetical protein
MFVYVIKNIHNGKLYVGQTTKTPEIRWKQHVKDSQNVKRMWHFGLAIRKWGEKSFEIIEVHKCDSLPHMDQLEMQLISNYNSTDKALGYNIDLGGQEHRVVSAGTRMKMSLIAKKSWQDENYRLTQSEKRKQTWLDAAHNIHQSKVKLKGNVIVTHPGGKEEEIQGLAWFCREHNVNPKHASRVLCGKRKSTSGYQFRYVSK